MVRNRQQYIAIRLNTSWALQLCSKCVQPPNNRNSREAEQWTPTCGSEAKQRRTLWGRSGRETEAPTRRSIKFPIFGLFCHRRLRIYEGMTANMWFVILAAFQRCLLVVCPESILQISNLSNTLNYQILGIYRFQGCIPSIKKSDVDDFGASPPLSPETLKDHPPP